MSAESDRIEALADGLDRIAEELSEAAMDILREAVFDGSEERAQSARGREKLLNRARSATEKAARLARQALSEAGSDEGDDD